MTEETLEMLMVKVTDGVATPAEYETLMAYLAEHPELAKELEMHRTLRAITDGWVHRLEQDLLNDRYEQRALPRLWTGLGVTLFLEGTAVLLGGGMAELLADPEAPLWVKLGLGGLGAGCVMLVAGMAWRRWMMFEQDPYTKVKR